MHELGKNLWRENCRILHETCRLEAARLKEGRVVCVAQLLMSHKVNSLQAFTTTK